MLMRVFDVHDVRELWDGPCAGVDDAVQFTGVDEVESTLLWGLCSIYIFRPIQWIN